VDGTLVDTNDAHAQAWVEAFRIEGLTIPYEKIRPLIGMGGDQLLPRVAGIEKESEQGKRLSDAWSRLFSENYLPHVAPLPGAQDLLRALHGRGLRVVAATSGEQEIADALLAKVGADPFLSGKTTSKDAEKSKPAPDIVEAARKKAGLSADAVVMLGDTPYDIEAARPLGIAAIALRSGGFPDDTLRGAAAIYDDPADLLAHLEDSPLFNEEPVHAGR
jgi:HAD superfamily hydrolase (TIGR01509 family)